MSDNGLPSFTPRKIPEGKYTFTISKEYEKRKHTNAQGDPFVSVTFFFKVDDGSGSPREHKESLLPWEDRYGDLLLALGGKRDEKGQIHASELVDIVGKKFQAEIKHEPDKYDPDKSWARIVNIETPESDEEDEVPF